MLFDIPKIKDRHLPIKEEDLNDPYCTLVNFIMYLYNSESFIYQDLNRASRSQDTSKADTLGPFSKIFGSIVAGISNKRADILPFSPENRIEFYRGALLTHSQVKEHK